MSSRLGALHPVGLYALCGVELCERFAGSLLGSLLLLYLNERIGMAPGTATRIGGAFNAVVYLSSVVGGIVADRWLGTRRAILLGAGLLAAGYAVLSLDQASLLYPSAGLLILGHALFKPSISSAVGKLYDPSDRRRDHAFSLFYVVFNIGSAGGPIAAGTLRATHGWSAAFTIAALAMLAACAVGVLSERWLRVPAGLPTVAEAGKDLPPPPWPWVAMAGLLAAGLLFTAAYAQIELSLLFWARDSTRRSLFGYALPPSGWLALPGLFVLGLQPLLTRTTATLTRQGCEPSLLTRIQVGTLSGAVAYLILVVAALLSAQQRTPVSPWWLVACFGALTLGELLVYPLSMALLTRLAPPRATAATMGLWLAALAGGHGLAGEVAARWATWPHVALFATLAGMALAASAVLGAARGRIQAAARFVSLPGRPEPR